jgi:hypothetical protein
MDSKMKNAAPRLGGGPEQSPVSILFAIES